MSPDPNTKKSTISSDNGQSIAYIDDFEGAKKLIPLSMGYPQWHDISIPDNLPFIGALPQMTPDMPASYPNFVDAQMNYKSKLYWYNITPSNVTVKDIYGNRKTAAPDQNQIQTLDIAYDPTSPGAYNWTPTLSDPTKNWAGIMTVLSSTANNLVDENIEFIEFYLKIDQAPPNLKLNIDLGQISEDVIPNGQLDTEDKNSNGLVDDGEDTGIDGLFDKDEPGYNPSTNPDPSHDDYSFQLGNGDYSHVNGTEGNVVAIDQGKLPDSEDLNGNFTLDRLNSYYRYTIPVDTNKNVNKYVQGGGGGGGNSGWYLIRIPLKDFTEQIGNPSLSVVQFIRFWISGASSKVHLRFAEMNLVGNQWQKVLNSKVTLQDTVLTVSTVSVEDNPDYVKPPGVQQELDKTQPNYTIYKNEQSLNLVLKNLQDGDNREIERYFTRTLDVFNYKEMKFFIHGDLNTLPGSVSEYIDSNNYGSEVYLRFGSDSVNYYEYRQPVRPDWNEVGLVFANLTAFKLRRDSSTAVVSVPVPGEPGHYYGVRGNPTLTSVSFFTIGILNPKDKGRRGQSVSGNVWIDELRVVGADQTPGWSYTANAALQLADVMRVSANISRTNPYFHKLNESFGNRQDNLNWGMAVDFDMLKVIPLNLAGSNMRISYSRNESYTNPLFLPGTDIKISDAQDELRRTMTEQGVNPADIVKAVNDLQTSTQTKNVSQTWTLSSMRIKVPTDIWYIRDLVNNITLGFNYNKTTGNSPTTETSDSWIWNANLGYSVQLNRDLFFKPATIPYLGPFFDFFTDYKDFKIYYAPQSITASITASRRRSFSLTRAQSTFDGSTTSTTTTNLVIQPTVLRDFSATRSAGFTWQLTEGGLWNISLNYNFDISSTLAYLLADSTTERSESQIWRSIFGGQLFGKDISYKQTVDIRTSPKLPSLWDLNRYINLNASYTVTYNWQNNLTQGDLGRSAGYSNRISAGFSFRLKSIFAPLFKESEKENQPGTSGDRQQSQQQNVRTGGRRSARANGQLQSLNEQRSPGNDAGITHSDTSKMKKDTLGLSRKDVKVSPNYLNKSLDYLKFFIKTVFFDYDQISVDLSQSSSYTGGGLAGEGTGFNNFWGFSQSDSKGPDRLFMLGLSNDLGLRNLGINTSITDNFTQRNDIDFKTTKPLWEGAQLDLSWKVGFGISRSSTFQADSIGGMKILSNTTTGTIERSFLSLPPIPLLSFLGNSGIKKVHDLYDPNSANPDAGLSDAFVQGFETFSFLEKVPILSKLAKYIPRPNWSFNWSGLEKYEFLSFAKRITISHAYVSNYSEGWMINPDGTKEIQSQIVDYGFQPLIGISFDFNKFFDGTLQSTIRYSTRSSYSLGASTHNITQAFTRDINITASYLRSGFEIPLFGISLKNDLEISFSYTIGQSSSIIFDLDNWIDSGTPQDGKTNTVIGPKIKYVMSQRVTLSIFYTRTKIEPEGASRLIPTTTNEAGIDVRISIQ